MTVDTHRIRRHWERYKAGDRMHSKDILEALSLCDALDEALLDLACERLELIEWKTSCVEWHERLERAERRLAEMDKREAS